MGIGPESFKLKLPISQWPLQFVDQQNSWEKQRQSCSRHLWSQCEEHPRGLLFDEFDAIGLDAKRKQ